MLSDTTPEVEKVWIELWRNKTPSERLARTFDLITFARSLSFEGIRRREPGLSEREQKLRFAEIHYGQEVAEGIREKWRQQDEADA